VDIILIMHDGNPMHRENSGGTFAPWCVLGSFFVLVPGTRALATTGVPPAIPAHLISLRADADPEAVARDFGLTPVNVYRYAVKGFSTTVPAEQMDALKHDNRVVTVEGNGRVEPCAQTIVSGVIRMGITNFPLAHINGVDERINVDVAVLDSGIQTNHPDLNVVHAVGFADPGLNGDDCNGHGTHVAGIVGALDNNIGVVGAAPGVRRWSVQVLGPTQYATANLLAGLDYIAQHADEIEVLNASLAGDGTSYEIVHQAVSNLVTMGIVFVAAAGNSSRDILGGTLTQGSMQNTTPAAFPEVAAITAIDSNQTNPDGTTNLNFDTLWISSNFSIVPKSPSLVNSPGAGIDLAEPGVKITSTYLTNGYATLTGTSMACAHASGLVALYIAANGRAHSAQDVYRIRQALVDSAQPQSAWANFPNTDDYDGNPEPLGVASLSWIPRMRFLRETTKPGGLQLNFSTLPGYTHTIQYKTSVNGTNAWSTLASTNGTGSPLTVVDNAATNSARVYRLATQPAP
jgi:subtilisin family serine protease